MCICLFVHKETLERHTGDPEPRLPAGWEPAMGSRQEGSAPRLCQNNPPLKCVDVSPVKEMRQKSWRLHIRDIPESFAVAEVSH